MSRLKSAGLGAGSRSISGGTLERSPGLLRGAGDSLASKSGIWGWRVACVECAAESAKYWKQLQVDTTKVPFSDACWVSPSPNRLARSMEATDWENAATAKKNGARKRILIALTNPRCHAGVLRCE